MNNDSSGAGLANANVAVGAGSLFSNVDGDSNKPSVSTRSAPMSMACSTTSSVLTQWLTMLAALETWRSVTQLAQVSKVILTSISAHLPAGSFAGTGSRKRTIRIGDVFNVATFIGGISGVQLPATRSA
jgi:hypothetical protein